MVKHSEIIQLLSQCHLCLGLDQEELKALIQIAGVREYGREQNIFMEGDPAGGFFVLLSGKVRVYKLSPEGKEYTLHYIKPGQIFAEAAIFQHDKFPANAEAVEKSIVSFFPKKEFINLMGRYPQISLKIVASMAKYIRDFNRQVEELSLKEVPSRLASYILIEAQHKSANCIRLEISKSELARQLGTISETLSRGFKKLKNAGVIEVKGKEIHILDMDKLSQIADSKKI